jgi:hypothetical protein
MPTGIEIQIPNWSPNTNNPPRKIWGVFPLRQRKAELHPLHAVDISWSLNPSDENEPAPPGRLVDIEDYGIVVLFFCPSSSSSSSPSFGSSFESPVPDCGGKSSCYEFTPVLVRREGG